MIAHHRLLRLLLIMFITLVLVTIFEVIKGVLLPDFGQWETSALTTGFFVIVTGIGYLIEWRIYDRLDEKARQEEIGHIIAKTSLKERNADLSRVERIAHVGSWDWNIQTGEIQCSDESYSICGLKPDVPMTVTLFNSLIHPDDFEVNRATVQKAIEQNAPFTSEYRIIRKDGAVRNVINIGEALGRDSEGKPLRIFGALQDITEFKQAQSELEIERKMLRTLIDSLPDYIYVKDVDSRFVLKNIADARWMGAASSQEVVGKTDFDFYPFELAQQFFQDDQTVIRTGQTLEREEPSIDPSGNMRWMYTTKVPLRDGRGNITGLVGISRDMTEHRRALEEIERLKYFNENIIQTMSEGILMEDADGLVSFANPAVEAMLGYSKDEMIGQPMVSFLPPDQVVTLLRANQRRLRGEADHYELVFHSKEGNRIDILVSGLPRFKNGKFNGSLAVFMNITDLKRVEQRSKLQLQRLTALHEIDLAINGSMDLPMILNLMLAQVVMQLEVDAADILLYSPGMQTLEFGAGYGFRTSGIKRTLLWLGEGLAGVVALERRTIHVPDLALAGSRFTRTRLLADESFKAYFGLPLVAKGQIKGVLEIFHRGELDLSADRLGFLEAIATQAAIAMENSELFTGLERSNLDLMLAYDATIEGWSQALDLRDRETEGHTQRVTEMTLLLADALGLSDEEQMHIRRGSLLHDIGKMGIPDNILLKPGPLTPDEWVVMRQHPVYAYNLLSPILFLRSALDIPYGHHEKWDGSGYPRGLKGEEIPLAARAFAIVDVWDALCSARPYRDALPEEEALTYIREQSGKHFDPRVVETFLQLRERIKTDMGASVVGSVHSGSV
jgi:PAS domain S-box-containing protein